MKKIILVFILLLGLITEINAQDTSFGLKANGSMTNIKSKKLREKKNNFEPGITVSAFAHIEFSPNLAIQPELSMSYTEGKIRFGYERFKYEYSSVEVPIFVLGQFESNSGKFFFGLGPIVGYGFDSENAKWKIGNSSGYDYDWPGYWDGYIRMGLNHWYGGGAGIIGYELHNGVTFQAEYRGLKDLRSNKRNRSKIDIHTISFGIGYRFK